MRINFIFLALFLVLCITIFNLFYKQQLVFNPERNIVNLDTIPFPFNPFDKLFCPINGFKCPDETCECSEYCKGNYEKLNIFHGEDIILFNEKLTPGTYCLPKGALKCHLKSSIPVYSINDWICVSRNNNIWNKNNFIACKNSYAKDNSLNVLFDRKSNQAASTLSNDYYEMFNGKLRFECQCGSLDIRGNKMIALKEVPFTCVSDYCLVNFKNVIQDIGWRNDQCNCGPYSHENPKDLTSPCVNSLVGMNNNIYTGIVKCTNKYSLEKEPIYCGLNDSIFTFEKEMAFHSIPLHFLK